MTDGIVDPIWGAFSSIIPLVGSLNLIYSKLISKMSNTNRENQLIRLVER